MQIFVLLALAFVGTIATTHGAGLLTLADSRVSGIAGTSSKSQVRETMGQQKQAEPKKAGHRPIWLLGVAALGLIVSSCGKSDSEQANLQNPSNEDVPGHDSPVTGVAAPTANPGTLASLADEAATFKGSSADLAVKLEAVQTSLADVLPKLPEQVRAGVTEDLQSMQDAADANDWEGAQEAAASIAGRLKSLPTIAH